MNRTILILRLFFVVVVVDLPALLESRFSKKNSSNIIHHCNAKFMKKSPTATCRHFKTKQGNESVIILTSRSKHEKNEDSDRGEDYSARVV